MKISDRILTWNKARNNLEFDPKLEAKLLSEEANEFFMAETTAHKLQELADFFFVLQGTHAKYAAVKHEGVEMLLSSYDKWTKLMAWVEEISSYMYQSLIPRFNGINNLDDALKFAEKCVLEANELKGTTKDGSGKVQKGAEYVSPLRQINEYLEARPFICKSETE